MACTSPSPPSFPASSTRLVPFTSHPHPHAHALPPLCKTALTEHDEYWHEHVDRITYGSFDYTCLLYLSTYNEDFEGGRFAFADQDWTTQKHMTHVEPVQGRLSCFTSGSENKHRVEPVR